MTLFNFGASQELLKQIWHYPKDENTAEDEEFWKLVRQAYAVSPSLVNLNNAGLSPHSRQVQEAQIRYMEFSNEAPSFNMWRVLGKDKEPVRKRLALLAGASEKEIAIQRNATEALDTIIFGLDLKKGDQVVLCKQDYPLMIHAWNQRAMREGIELRWVNLNLPSENKQEMIDAYVSLFTKKTKVVQLTHMINWTGQVIPAREIAEIARSKGIKVILDAAQSFAQLDFKLADMGADYAGTALHKWLGAPIGTGMLYVKEENIADLWPLFPTDQPKANTISKFENLGTRPTYAELAIGQAIEFHKLIGSQRKHERLLFLSKYWVEQVKDLPRFRLHSSLQPEFGGAIINFSIEGRRYLEISQRLQTTYRIHTSPVKWDGVEGVRATPNVYTSLYELDRLVEAIKALAS